MKFAIFGDIHANLEALEAVLTDAAAQDCTHFTCLGDIVGYNANPRECLQVVQQLDCPVVKGNHDEEASMDTEIIGLNCRAAGFGMDPGSAFWGGQAVVAGSPFCQASARFHDCSRHAR